MKKTFITIGLMFLTLPVPLFLGAGCSSGPQATIDDFVMGKKDAPVQITEYYDYQCPSCKAYQTAIVPFIIEDYVDTGEAAITFKNMAFIGPESQKAAIAALCAQEQGKFFDYHKALFEMQDAENSGVFTDAKLKSVAAEVGLDISVFDKSFESQKYRDQVAEEKQQAYDLGVDATPTFIINGQKVTGGSYLSIKRVIDKKLEEMGKKNK